MLISQNETLIDIDNFDQLLMEVELQEAINEARIAKKLSKVLRIESLDAAAFDQAEYNQKNNKEGHDQDDEDQKEVTQRVRHFGGMFYEIGELIYTASIGIPIKVKSGATPLTISSYEQAATIAIEVWLKNENTKTILLDSSYYSLGVAASFNTERNEISIISILASPPFELKGEKDRVDEYALKEYNKTICDGFVRTNSFLPELLSDKIIIEDKTIYLINNDREVLSEILSDGRDGFAVDLISANQFHCNGGNGLFPSNFHEGLLLRPIKGATLNYKTPEGEYLDRIKLGELPQTYSTETTNINLLLFKDAVVCNYIPFNKMDAKNLHWIEPEWELDISEQTNGLMVDVISYPTENIFEIKTFIESLKTNNTKNVDINIAYSPVLTSSIDSVKLTLNNATQEIVDKVKLTFINNENTIADFISNRMIALEIKDLNEDEKWQAIRETDDQELIEFIRRNHQTTITVTTEAELANYTSEELKTNYLTALENNKLNTAKTLQSELIRRLKSGDESAKSGLATNNIKQTKENLTLISNATITSLEINSDNLINREMVRKTLLGLYLIDKTNQIIAYNLCLSILYAWELGKKAPVTPSEWEEYYKSASANGVIDSEKLKKLNTNFHLLSADYYYDKGNIRERKKSLESAYANIISSKCTLKESIMYAQYFMFQLQINWAATILKKELKRGFDLEVAEQLVSLASYPSSEISPTKISELLHAINLADHERFCKIFKDQKANYLFLKDPLIKVDYCRDCIN